MPDTVTVPKFNELMWPTLQAIQALGGSGSIHEIDEKVAELVGFSEQQQAVLHTDGPQTEIEYRLAWARTYLKAVGGLVNSSRGVWSITEIGKGLKLQDIAGIPAKVRALAPKKPTPKGVPISGDALGNGDEPDDWKEKLLQALVNLPPKTFERLAQRLLREAGFISVTVTGQSGDGGIDGLGVYRLSLMSFPVFFQCKRYSGSVGAGAIRDFRGAMAGRGDKGLLITTGTFTGDAKHEATRDGAPPIDLIDGDQLCGLLKNFGLGVETVTRQVEDVKLNLAFFAEM
jgi:restriction system protein